jgi:hypothetical protein
VDRDDLPLVRQEVPVDRGRNRIGVRNQPHVSVRP